MASEGNVPLVPRIAIEPREWEELVGILRTHLPNRRVWAFGSRATGRARRFSDLDLAVEGESLPFGALAKLRDALDESGLPFKVDIVELASLTPEFSARIEPEFVLLQSRV